ncbi:chromosome transmission fidelity protein 8 homolog isoform X2 [Oratosquilla oratoria]|uniref:chromosome transmission fidelity protein 8 homolog isoform X2 n=1 Tax=Oratosquilla oratoria TaxID=337810 RepID=UPI003F771A91
MQIPIKIIGDDGLPQWVLVELQGDLTSRTEQALKDKFIGDLHYTRQGVPVLIIGHHILYGKVQDLRKPFAVMEKVKMSEGAVMIGSAPVVYHVKAVIRKKLLFNTRPKPIIANVPKSTK